MKKVSIILIIVLVNLLSTFGFSGQNQPLFQNPQTKIFITTFEKLKGGAQYDFLKAALPRSIAVTFNRTYKTEFGETAPGNENLQNLGYQFLITGKFTVIQNELNVTFEIKDLKRNLVIIEAQAVGSSEGRQIFNLIDRLSGLLVVVSIPSAAMNQKIKINIDKAGKVTTTLGGFVGTDLRGADFTGQDLSNRDFTGANLEGANFTNCILTDTNFTRANLKSAIFTGAQITRTIFNGANLPSVNFSKSKFSAPNFSGAFMQNAFFEGADLTSAHFERTDLTGANLSGGILIKARMKLALLKNANLTKAILKGVHLSETELTEVNFEGADLSGAKLNSRNLKKANLKKTICIGTDFSSAQLNEADFTQADLSQAVFINARLNKTILSETQLNGTQFSEANMVEAVFTNARFNNTDFTGAIINGSKMLNAKLSTVNFQRSSMQGADLTGSDISGVNFSQVNLTRAILVNVKAVETKFESANLHHAVLTHSNLENADFHKINGTYGNFRNTRLKKARFTEADLRYADFTDAVYNEANYLGSDIKHSKFSGEPPETFIAKLNIFGLSLTGNFSRYNGGVMPGAANVSSTQEIGMNIAFRGMIFGYEKNSVGFFFDAGYDLFKVSENGDVLGVPYSESVKIQYLSLSAGVVFKISKSVLLYIAPFAQYGIKISDIAKDNFRRFNFGGQFGLGFFTRMSHNALFYLGLEIKFQALTVSETTSARILSAGLNISFLFH